MRPVTPFYIFLLSGCADGLSLKLSDSTNTLDLDGDGFSGNQGDCDDDNPAIYPNANELCDLIDNNCNGEIDEQLRIERYPDEDNDGFGDPNAAQDVCDDQAGFVDNGDDCDDSDPLATNRQEDADCDGSLTAEDCDDNDPNSNTIVNDADCDGIPSSNDCDDNDPTILNQTNDADCDGIDIMDDCDDNDPNANAISEDADCDGALTAEDCDDGDPNLGAMSNDHDCDGIPGVDDCNDYDPQSPQISLDADCDGTNTADDCDDNDAMSTTLATDADCDGTTTGLDCDDNDPWSTTIANDADCDTFITIYDCDDNDPNSYTTTTDGDCDGVPTALDCDDNNPNSTTVATDADCDGIVTGLDCDDNNPNSTAILNDSDCDGTVTILDCDDNDPNSTTVATDADCDGILPPVDCDNNDPSSTTTVTDGDCDGIITANDCDDSDPNAHSIFDDGDCDGFTQSTDCDDNNPTSYTIYEDADCDGYLPGVDCDDNDPWSFTVLQDADCDGDAAGSDCNDSDPDLNFHDLDGDGYSSCPFSPCFELDMNDSAGNAWNGAYLTVYADGVAIGTYSAAGSNSVELVCPDAESTVAVHYTSGSYENQNSYAIRIEGGIDLWVDNAEPYAGEVLYLPVYGDCDDGDPDTHPFAEEIEDVFDNNCDGNADLLMPWDVNVGDVIISEMQVNPVVVQDKYGEYLEVFNDSSQDISLMGFRIIDDSDVKRRIDQDIVLYANEYSVWGPTTSTTNNGGVAMNWGWGVNSFFITNNGDKITLNSGQIDLDIVEYTSSWPFNTGRAMELKLGHYGVISNNYSGNWCTAADYYSADNRGTPGYGPSCN